MTELVMVRPVFCSYEMTCDKRHVTVYLYFTRCMKITGVETWVLLL